MKKSIIPKFLSIITLLPLILSTGFYENVGYAYDDSDTTRPVTLEEDSPDEARSSGVDLHTFQGENGDVFAALPQVDPLVAHDLDVTASTGPQGEPTVWVRERPSATRPTVQWLQITTSAVETINDNGTSYSPRANVLLWQATYNDKDIVRIVRIGQVGALLRYRDWVDNSFSLFRLDFNVLGGTIQRNFKVTKEVSTFLSAGFSVGFHKFATTWGPLGTAELRGGVRLNKKFSIGIRAFLSTNAPDRYLAAIGPVAIYDINENVSVTAEVYYAVPVLYSGGGLPGGVRFQNNLVIRLPQFRENSGQ